MRISLTALQRFFANATQLPKEFVLELDLENVELVETKPFNPLQVKTACRRLLRGSVALQRACICMLDLLYAFACA